MSTYETYEYQRGPFQPGEYETFETGYETYEGEDEQFLGDLLKTVGKVVGPQLPGIAQGIFGALTSGASGPLSATQEMELTAELLEITSEEELEEFLGNVLSGVSQAVGGVIGPERAQALGGFLKGMARDALPIAGNLAGTLAGGALIPLAAPATGPLAIGLPLVGGAVGQRAAERLASLFELELEGMTQEQAGFEMGRRVLRMAATSAAHAAKTPGNVPPKKAARAAITKAARQHAPGLLSGAGGGRGRQQPGAGGGPRGQRQRRPGAGGRQPVPGGRPPLGAAAFPDSDAAAGVPGYAGGPEPEPDDPSATEPTYGAPDWSEPEPDRDGPEGAGPRGRSGRWIRRGRQIVLLGA